MSAAGHGAEDLLALSRHLKAAGETELRKEFHKAITAAAKPLIPLIREAARADLPHRGGLNERIARKPLRAQTRTGVTTVGVRIVGTRVDPRIDQGRVYHPVFGRTGRPANGGKNSVVQQVPQAVGYFEKPLQAAAPQVHADIVRVMDEWTQRLLREGI